MAAVKRTAVAINSGFTFIDRSLEPIQIWEIDETLGAKSERSEETLPARASSIDPITPLTLLVLLLKQLDTRRFEPNSGTKIRRSKSRGSRLEGLWGFDFPSYAIEIFEFDRWTP